ncbi:hypothetical protein [Hwangdonia lutea]|uniref:MORN repeat protein n=1 Tax=Hwangdonia lutea TaxID=3075823 RepID=A0AA97EKV9_9FLAO|nr:hypothetical protein [Hwangdonia sp. SCSIO 19198]WOD43314.1 hypothetical protein RNZ46_15095 [Hwangdonia sp. SCSIO 19198]
MKNLIYVFALLFIGSAMAQEKPKEVKQETKVKVVKTKNDKETKEKKVKVITRETADVKLDKNDKNKVNQSRVNATKKVEKMVMVDDDNDADYDILTKETFFVSGDQTYKFTPNDKGFDIIFDNDNNEFVKIGKAWSTSASGNYIIRGEMHNGIGYFDKNGNFVVEYFDENTKRVKKMTYSKEINEMK